MARLLALSAVAVLLCAGLAAGAAANEGCRDVVTGYSGTFGKRGTSGTERFNNQTAQWKAKGSITKVNLYYSGSQKCVMGIKATYGYNSQDAKIIGAERNMETRDIILGAGEHISKAQIKYSNCVEFVRLVTNRGRVLELGNKDSALQLITSYPNKPTGFLAAIRGYEEYHAMASGASLRGPMRTLQFVWANCNAVGSGAVARPAVPHNTGFKAPATPARAPAAKAAARPAAPPAAEPFYEDPTPAEGPADGGTATEADAAAAADAGAAGGAALPSCPAQLDMCAPDASSTSTAYCPVLSPFTSAACVGGCCASSGKCTSSSCAISGVGQEVPNTICYGLNPAIAIGASPNCRGLACKLAIPGCTSDLLGGSCLGSVVDLSGSAAADNPAGAALVGYPCLDVTPSDKTLTAEGKLSLSGEYVAKLWSICDCQAPATIGSTNIPVPHLGKLNITDITSLVNALKPSVNGGEGAGKGLQGVLEALKSKLPSMVVPDGASAANLTNALGFLGSLVGKGGGAAGGGGSPAAGIADLVKGASALAAAANSTNPLGSLLGALAAPGANGGNPLAGLGNLVSALAPQGSDTTERADVLNALLSGLSGSTAAAPHADLVGAVTRLLSGGGGAGGAADLAALLPKIKGNSSELMKTVMSAVQQGKDAVGSGKVDLQGLLDKAKAYVGAGGNPGVAAVLDGIQGLANPHGAEGGAAANPLAFLGSLKNASGGAMSLQNIVDYAHQAGPLLQQLANAAQEGGGEGGANPVAGLLRAIQGGEGGQGMDLASVLSLAQKAGPLLQALGGGSGADGAGAVPGGNPLASLLGQVGLGAGGAPGEGLNMEGVRGLLDAAKKAGPLLNALTKASGEGGNSPLAGLQGFIDKLPKMGGGAPRGVDA